VQDLREWFWSRVEVGEACWNWKGRRDHAGYGMLRRGGKNVMAHRLSYELTRGLIPDGLEIDHLCWNARCVRPSHLRAVTHTQNMRNLRKHEQWRPSGVWSHLTHCMYGHELTPDNMLKGSRLCRTCHNWRQMRSYYKRIGRLDQCPPPPW